MQMMESIGIQMGGTGAPDAAEKGPGAIVQKLHDLCSAALAQSLDAKFDPLNASSYGLASDLDSWAQALASRPEQKLYVTASSEYVLALLNNSQGQYRNAFKGLRLILELVLQGAYLSVYLVSLNEWLNSQADTAWSGILDLDRGVFAKRFCRAFFPELEKYLDEFKALSETLYREMSECIHGNVPNKIPLPAKIEFDEPTFTLWHEKAGTLRYIVNFVLTMRYARELSEEQKAMVQAAITDQLNHVEGIRTMFGGPVTE